MKFSENWLHTFLHKPIETEQFVHKFTMAGLEVDGFDPVCEPFEHVVVGQVKSVAPHPDAKKLKVCQVFDGQDTVQVVCGASNVREGLKVAFAKVNARLPRLFEDPQQRLTQVTLRGVDSFGMLCSEQELGLGEGSEGIWELSQETPVGEDLWTYLDLNDKIIDIDLTPNRGDCLGMVGIAREAGTLFQVNVHPLGHSTMDVDTSETIKVDVQAPAACPTYIGRVVSGINPQANTPLWMKNRLNRSGIRCLMPVVDILNYVMLEMGQPMHAFDLNTLNDHIVVRYAKAQEKMELLDGQSVSLREDTLVIADMNGPIAMAGIMGGQDSGVSETTHRVFLESAYFAPETISGKARSYGLHTDSSYRFERGVDPTIQKQALERASQYIIEICGGQCGPIVSQNAHALPDKQLTLRESQVKRILGFCPSPEEVTELLQRLGCQIQSETKDVAHLTSWSIQAPKFRHDIELEIDLIEEIGRIYGFDKLPMQPPTGEFWFNPNPEHIVPLMRIKRGLADLGYHEAINYSFVCERTQSKLEPKLKGIPLLNPISSDMGVMRTTLWPGLVKALLHNLKRQQDRILLFEEGLCFEKNQDEITQVSKIGGIGLGNAFPENWNTAQRPLDFFDIKGHLETIWALSQNGPLDFKAHTHPALHPGQSAQIFHQNRPIGWLGQLHPSLCQDFSIHAPVYLFECTLGPIQEAKLVNFKKPSRFPSVRRDLALVVERSILAAKIIQYIQNEVKSLLAQWFLFDVYEGPGVDSGKKSLAIGLILQHASRTLVDQEVDDIMTSLILGLKTQFGAELRG